MNDNIWKISERTVDWLKYAEAKNGALLAFAALLGGTAAGLLKNFGGFAYFYGVNVVLFSIAGILVLLITFVSILNRSVVGVWLAGKVQPQSAVFVSDIASQSLEDYKEKISHRLKLTKVDEMDLDIIEQIHAISKLADRKFRLFNVALWCVVVAVGTPIAAVVLLILRKNREI